VTLPGFSNSSSQGCIGDQAQIYRESSFIPLISSHGFLVVLCFSVLLAQFYPPIQSSLTPDLVIGLGALVEAGFDPGGLYVSSLSEYAVRIWYLNGSFVSVYPGVEGVPFTGHAWSPGGDMIAVSDYLGHVFVLRVPELSVFAMLGYDYGDFTGTAGMLGVQPRSIKWSDDGLFIGLGWCNERCYIYNLSGRKMGIWVGQNDSTEDVEGFDWSQDTGLIAVGSWDRISVYSLVDGQIFQEEEDGYVTDFINISLYEIPGRLPVFSPDDSLLAVLGDTSLDVYNSVSGSISFSISNIPANRIRCMSWLPGGKYIALGTIDGDLLVLDLFGMRVVSNLSAHSSGIRSVSCTDQNLASAADQSVKIWRIDPVSGSAEWIRTFSGWENGVRTALWFPDNNHVLATYNRGGPLKIYSLGENDDNSGLPIGMGGYEELRIDMNPGSGELLGGVISPDGKMIAAITEDEGVSIWDGVSGTLAYLPDLKDVLSLRWNPEKPGVLAVGGRDGFKIIDVLDPRQEEAVSSYPLGEWVMCIDWSPSGDMLAVGLLSTMQIWDTERQALLVSQPIWRYPNAVAWSPDGSRIASLAGFDWRYDREELPPEYSGLPEIARVTVWDVDRPNPTQIYLHHVDDAYLLRIGDVSLSWDLAWSPNSTMICAGTGFETFYPENYAHRGLPTKPGIMIWGVEAGTLVPKPYLTGPTRWVTSVDWSPDGSKIIAGANDGGIWIWRVGPAEIICEPFIGLAAILIVLNVKHSGRSQHHTHAHRPNQPKSGLYNL